FGYAIFNEIKDAQIAILDNSKDDLSIKLDNKILSSGYFTLHNYLQNNDQIEKEFQEGHTKLILVIGDQFAYHLAHDGKADVQILADASDPNIATTLTAYANAIIADFQRERMYNQLPPFTITPEVKMYYNPELKSVYLFVPGLLTIIMMLI